MTEVPGAAVGGEPPAASAETTEDGEPFARKSPRGNKSRGRASGGEASRGRASGGEGSRDGDSRDGESSDRDTRSRGARSRRARGAGSAGLTPSDGDPAEDASSGKSPAGKGPTGKGPTGKDEDPRQFARDVVYRLLAVRARSTSELRDALLKKGIEQDLASSTVQKFVDAGLVDDAAFAQEWVHARHNQQGLGRKALGFELRRKGVADEFVEQALSTVDAESEVDRARELVRRKLRGMGSADSATRTRRLVGMLARKGYSEGLAFRVVREEMDEASAEDAVSADADPLAEDELP